MTDNTAETTKEREGVFVDKDQRRDLWEFVFHQIALTSEGLVEALQECDPEEAQVDRVWLEDACRLLDDLSWDLGDERDRYELTLPPQQLRRSMERVKLVTEILLEACSDRDASNGDDPEEAKGDADNALDGRAACDAVLQQLGPGADENPYLERDEYATFEPDS